MAVIETIIMIATVTIAVVALYLTWWQTRATRQHNRLSVKPILTFVVHYGQTEDGFGIYLKNNGFGPAIIIDIKFFVDGKEVERGSSPTPWSNVNSELGIGTTYRVHQGFYDEGTALAVGGEPQSICAVTELLIPEATKHFESAIRRIGLIIEYESIYKIKDIEKLHV